MSESSVDDRYEGCTEKMANLVETKYLSEEITANISGFGTAWNFSAEIIPEPEDNLNKKHLIAISVYSGRTVYNQFNQDVRSGKLKYKNMKYAWYSLHFLLTEAIQILKKTQEKCILTYRRTNVTFNETVLYKEIRFGSFASSSLDRDAAKIFGNESCFKIKTCYGANVTKYSLYPDEREVLIPPYEKFKVTEIKKNDWCKTVFVLESSGIRSDLNCAVASAESQIYHRCLSLWLTSFYIFIHFSFLY
ncbi:NAD(P)(+)--arginine ADP-ribosyltransferase 2-like [Misgurnus anguillicaudatus]|uniref:NAD(P)(+)--arginine ADP-ribosyltransferase 2-like n=1 Tax=Misgurnus anguillicaudatus TaxID=75329 RepID=UPI003CCF15AC